MSFWARVEGSTEIHQVDNLISMRTFCDQPVRAIVLASYPQPLRTTCHSCEFARATGANP